MKKILSLLAVAAIAAMTVIGCKKPDPEPEPAKTEFSVSTATGAAAANLSAAASGEVLILTVKSNVAWTAKGPDWAVIAPASGNGNGAVKITVAENTGEARTGDVTFSYDGGSTKVTINQSAAGTTPEPAEGIASAADMISFLNTAATIAETETVKITADIDLAGQTIPAGVEFAGILDGQGHTIKNMKSTKGLIDVLTGTVKDLKIDSSCEINYTAEIPDMMGLAFIAAKSDGNVLNCEVAGKIIVNTATAGRIYCAGLVGEQPTGYIEGCKFTGSIDVTLGTSQSCSAIAGIVARPGKSVDTAGKVIVKDCVNEGNIKFLFNGASGGMKKFGIGGVVGQTPSFEAATEGDISRDCGIVEGCTNKGDLEWSYPEGGNGSYPCLGGVAGIVEGQMIACNNYGKLKYTGSKTTACTDAAFGGVAGILTLGASDCHNYGTFEIDAAIAGGTALKQSGGNTEYSCFGGVFASAGPYVTASKKTLTSELGVVVENCTNEAEIIFTPSMVNSGGPQMCFGGVVGANTAILRNCHNNKPVTVKSNTRTIDAGAITGWTVANIENCTNNAAFVVDAELANHQPAITYTQCYVGGITGKCFGVEIKNCVNNAAVTLQNVFKSPDNMSYVGGITANYDGAITMTGCENKGDVTLSGDTAFRVGGIAGAFNGTMSNTKNSGKVSSTAAFETSVAEKAGELGGITGYSAAYATTVFSNVEQTGDVLNNAVGGAVGGMIGATGLPSETCTYVWDGCTVNCAVTGTAPTKAAVLGWFNTAPTESTTEPGTFTQKVTLQLGTATAPFKVLGAAASLDLVGNLNGHVLDATNVQK